MSLSRTTLAAACAAGDTAILLASISNLAVGQKVLIDAEEMRVQAIGASAAVPVRVYRGIGGTAVKAHASGAGVVFGASADFASPRERRRDVVSYSAAGAITLPTPGNDMVAILNGTSALAMTVADPAKDNDGDLLIVVGNGKAAHTLTNTAGYGDGGSGYDVLTYAAGARNASAFIAANEKWVLLPSLVAGTATAVSQTIA